MSVQMEYTKLPPRSIEKKENGKEETIFEMKDMREASTRHNPPTRKINSWAQGSKRWFRKVVVPRFKANIFAYIAVAIALLSLLIVLNNNSSLTKAMHDVEEMKQQFQKMEYKNKLLRDEVTHIKNNFSDCQIHCTKKVEDIIAVNTTEKDSILISQGIQIKQLNTALMSAQANVTKVIMQNEEFKLQLLDTTQQLLANQAKLSEVTNQMEVRLNETTRQLSAKQEMLSELLKKNEHIKVNINKTTQQLLVRQAELSETTSQIEVRLNETIQQLSAIKTELSDVSTKIKIKSNTATPRDYILDFKTHTRENFTKLSNDLETHIASTTTKLEQTVNRLDKLEKDTASKNKDVKKCFSDFSKDLANSAEQSKKNLENKVKELREEHKNDNYKLSSTIQDVKRETESTRLSLSRKLEDQERRVNHLDNQEASMSRKIDSNARNIDSNARNIDSNARNIDSNERVSSQQQSKTDSIFIAIGCVGGVGVLALLCICCCNIKHL